MHVAACRDILLFPRGNREVRNQGLSLYLNVSDAELAPPGWLRKAQFRLTVVNQANPEASVWKGACACGSQGNAGLRMLHCASRRLRAA